MAGNKVTIKDIADAVGVSTSLVSFVMNNKGKRYRVSEEMTKKILAAAKELNYKPNNAAKSLRSGKSNAIGVIISDISNKFFADIARCIEDHAYRHNYTVIFGSSDEDAKKLERLMADLINRGVDGLIIVPCEGAEEAIGKVAQTNIPIVLLDRDIQGLELSHVVLNNRKAMIMATESLIKQGFTKIDLVSYDLKLSNAREREEGYMAAMKEHGLSKNARVRKVGFKNIPERMSDIMKEIKASPGSVEAMVFSTNTLTIEGLKAMRNHGIVVPDNIAVVGFDGSEAFDLYYTSMSYIRQPIEQFGLEALELIIKTIEEGANKYSTATIVLNPSLIEAESSKRACDKLCHDS